MTSSALVSFIDGLLLNSLLMIDSIVSIFLIGNTWLALTPKWWMINPEKARCRSLKFPTVGFWGTWHIIALMTGQISYRKTYCLNVLSKEVNHFLANQHPTP